MTANELVTKHGGQIERSGPDGVQLQARCPAHDDRTASLAVKILPTGKVLLHCHAGCTSTKQGLEEVRRGLGLVGGASTGPITGCPPSQPEAKPLPPLNLDECIEPLTERQLRWLERHRCVSPAVAQRFRLGSARGRLALPVVDPKLGVVDIRLWLPPGRRDGVAPKITSWERGRGGSKLFGQAGEVCLLCGGELDALVAISLGYDCMTTTGSESSFPAKLAQELRDRGVRHCNILLDNDETGRKGAVLRSKRLADVGITSMIVGWPEGTEEKWDITDEVAQHGSLDRLEIPNLTGGTIDSTR